MYVRNQGRGRELPARSGYFANSAEASVLDYLSYLPYVSFAAVVLGAIGLVYSSRKPRQKDETCEIVTDWQPTGKIDFAQSGADASARFYLHTEEYRVLQSMSGTRRVEVRWRPATLDEAKRVASWTNSRETNISLPLPASTRTASLVPKLPEQEPLPGGDEHSHIVRHPH